MSTLPGIIHITGEHDVGKTTMALECGAMPEKICFFDDDLKGRSVVQDLEEADVELGAYHDLVTLGKGKKGIDFYHAVMEVIDKIKPGQFEVIIFDTWARFAGCMHEYVLAHPQEFRSKYSAKGDIKGGQQWQDTHRLEAETLTKLQSLARTVILVTHLRDHRMGGVVTGKQEPQGSKTLSRVCRLRVWLRPNADSPVPIALVLKRLDTKVKSKSGALRTVSVLPRKIVPDAATESVWDTIAQYITDPVDTKKLRPHEIPDAYELSLLEGTLTAEQKRTFQQMLDAGLIGLEPEEIDIEAIAEKARELSGPPKGIADALSEEFGTDVTVAQVVRWRWADD